MKTVLGLLAVLVGTKAFAQVLIPQVGCSAHFEQEAQFDGGGICYRSGDLNSPQVYFEDYQNRSPGNPQLVVADVPLKSYAGAKHPPITLRIYLRKADSQLFKTVVILSDGTRIMPNFPNTAFASDAGSLAHLANGWRRFNYKVDGGWFDSFNEASVEETLNHINCSVTYQSNDPSNGQIPPPGGYLPGAVSDP